MVGPQCLTKCLLHAFSSVYNKFPWQIAPKNHEILIDLEMEHGKYGRRWRLTSVNQRRKLGKKASKTLLNLQEAEEKLFGSPNGWTIEVEKWEGEGFGEWKRWKVTLHFIISHMGMWKFHTSSWVLLPMCVEIPRTRVGCRISVDSPNTCEISKLAAIPRLYSWITI